MVELPDTRRGPDVDVRHGERVPDPYRWLEDTWAPETESWVRAQNAVTREVLDRLDGREDIQQRVSELLDVVRHSAPRRHGDRWLFTRKEGLADQPLLVVADAPDDDGRVLLDPNQLSADGTVALSAWSVDPAGRWLAYGVSDAGSDWVTWRVRDVATGRDRDDEVRWSKFSGAEWLPDGSGFYYGALDVPEPGGELLAASTGLRLQLHLLGTPADRDELVYADPDPEWIPDAMVTDDGRWLVVESRRGTRRDSVIRLFDLDTPDRRMLVLVPEPVADSRVVGNHGDTIYLLTDLGAPRRRVVAVDSHDPAPAHWREVVPQGDDRILDVRQVGGQLVCHLLHDASSRLQVWAADGAPGPVVQLPGPLTVTELSGRHDDPLLHVAAASFTDPGSVYGCDVTTGEVHLVRRASLSPPLSDIVTERVHATSADGTPVPMFLVHQRDVAATGDVRTLLYGYGGFDIPLTPTFSPAQLTWVERGGLLAVANLRGGGEFDRAWYDAGRLAHKQNVFDDAAGCARWLARSGWSRPERIALNGGSNGGLLVGALLTQFPELIGAAVPEVGVLDMLRFHRFTIGWAWTSDYGDPDDREQYQWVRAYSPLHRITTGTRYPPTMVMTGDHDDRVVPGHSFKFAAALQAAQGGDAPVLIRVETSAGHGAGKPTRKILEERTDLVAFCEAALDGRLPRCQPNVGASGRSGSGGAPPAAAGSGGGVPPNAGHSDW